MVNEGHPIGDHSHVESTHIDPIQFLTEAIDGIALYRERVNLLHVAPDPVPDRVGTSGCGIGMEEPRRRYLTRSIGSPANLQSALPPA
jgi:hypothetical protein